MPSKNNSKDIVVVEEEQKVDNDDCSTSVESSSIINKATKRVSSVTFHTVEIREYSRCLGNNPATSYGPPLSIDWDYTTKGSFRLDDDEDKNGETKEGDEGDHSNNPPLRRSNSSSLQSCYVPPEKRTAILLEQSDATLKEINDAAKEIRVIQRDRQMSISMQEFDSFNMMLESLGRKLKRVAKGIFTFKREQQLLWEKAAKRKQKKMLLQKNGTSSSTPFDNNDDCDTTRTSTSDSFSSAFSSLGGGS